GEDGRDLEPPVGGRAGQAGVGSHGGARKAASGKSEEITAVGSAGRSTWIHGWLSGAGRRGGVVGPCPTRNRYENGGPRGQRIARRPFGMSPGASQDSYRLRRK